jgi:hypothetical protein
MGRSICSIKKVEKNLEEAKNKVAATIEMIYPGDDLSEKDR